jgi:hypothetical protein
MNTSKTQRIRTATFATATATAVAFVVAAAGYASPGFAAPARGDGEGGAGTAAGSPYVQPIAALDGMTLAHYIQDHQAGDPRTFAGV